MAEMTDICKNKEIQKDYERERELHGMGRQWRSLREEQ